MNKIAFAVLVLALGVFAWWQLRPAQQSQDRLVETWIKGRGVGQQLKLFASGRYESAEFCDVCPPASNVGSWRVTGTALVLTPDNGRQVTLNRVSFRGCRALAVEGVPAPRLPTDVFFPASESCSNAL